jgi:hypothetical protein
VDHCPHAGDAVKQYEAIWQYLLERDKIAPPGQ